RRTMKKEKERIVIIDTANIGYIEGGNLKAYLNLAIGNPKKVDLEEFLSIIKEADLQVVITIESDELSNAFTSMTFGKVIWSAKLLDVLEDSRVMRNEMFKDKE
ncbi:MAG: hypothetical protein ACP5D6_10495, partial [Kosmotogaceae bacterium]